VVTRVFGTDGWPAISVEGDAWSYEPFSREPEYVEVNRRFVCSLDLRHATAIADLACGTGTMTALLLEELRRRGPHDATVAGVEPSAEALRLAAAYLGDRPGGQGVRLIAGSIEDLPLDRASVDVAVVGNAIQLIADKDRAVDEVRRVLRPDGTFGFNTSFYAGAYLPGTERFYLTWVEEAVRLVGSRQRSRRAAGVTPAFTNRWLSPDEYVGLLERHGFALRHIVEHRVWLTRHSLETIGAYAGLATVLLRGYPADVACGALQQAVAPALAAAGLDGVPRGWLEVTARRRANATDGGRAQDD
jgi:ubiquinone/menaquinone biosynthesis C-methylase UbiE